MIIEPDLHYYENGVYRWTPERRQAAWERSFDALDHVLSTQTVRKVVLLIGIPGSGKSTFAKEHDEPNVVIFDGVFAGTATRRRACEIAAAHGVPVEGFWFRADRETCLARNRQRSEDRRVPQEAIDGMLEQLTREPPSVREGFATIYHA